MSKPLNTAIDENLQKQIKLLSVERDTTIQKLVEEALIDLLRKYGKEFVVD